MRTRPILVKAAPTVADEKLSHRVRQGGTIQFSSKTFKVTCVLDPDLVTNLQVPVGVPRILFAVTAGKLALSGHVAPKGLRRAQARIAELGAENVAVLLQARLVANRRLQEVGISAQPKAPRPPAASAGVLSTPSMTVRGVDV
jgi:hypothetical protein